MERNSPATARRCCGSGTQSSRDWQPADRLGADRRRRLLTAICEREAVGIGLQFFVGMHATNYTQLMAASMMVVVPVILLYIFNQRYFVEGIKLSGLGGR